MVGEGAFGKDLGARCLRNVLAAAVCRGGWMDGCEGGGKRRPVELHSLQIVKKLSSLQHSTVYFTSSQQAATASPFCLESKHIYKFEVLMLYSSISILNHFIFYYILERNIVLSSHSSRMAPEFAVLHFGPDLFIYIFIY